MTWTKLSDDFGDDCARADLTDAAFRTHVEGLLWTMRRETDGQLDRTDVRRFAETDEPTTAVQELVDAGFWVTTEGGWRIVHHLDHQPESDVIAARRAANAERQRQKRRKAAGVGLQSDQDPSRRDDHHDDARDDRRDDTRDPGRVGSGRVGPGSTEGNYYGSGGARHDEPADIVPAALPDEPPAEDEPPLDEDDLDPDGWPTPRPLGRGRAA